MAAENKGDSKKKKKKYSRPVFKKHGSLASLAEGIISGYTS